MYYITSNDNTNIAVYDLNPTSSRTIVLIHGWPLSHKMFEYQIPILFKNNFRVISIDLRGFGMSDVTATGYSYNQFATDLYYVVCALNISRFCLLGFSMGGAVATKYMSLFQGYGVSSLCLLDAAVPSYCKTATNPYGQSIQSTNQLISLGYQDRPSLNQYFGSIFFNKKPSSAFSNWFQNLNDSASGLGEMQSLITLRDEDLWEDLKQILVPTAIIHGKQDKVCPFEMAKLTASQIPTSTLYPIENAGHGAFYEAKDMVNSKLVEFLNRYS